MGLTLGSPLYLVQKESEHQKKDKKIGDYEPENP